MSKQITLEGKTFSTIKEAAEYYNLDYVKIRNRLHIGWTLEEAFELVFRNNSYNSIIVDGKTFNSIREATEYYNLDYNTVFVRLKRGWSIEEAFELIDRNDTYKLITVEGKTFESVAEACRYYNLNSETIRSRLRDGWTIEEAFELVERKEKPRKGNEVILEGKTFNSISEACRHYNLNFETVHCRLRKGWTVEEAFELVERKEKPRKGNEVILEGKTFVSLTEAAKYYNFKFELIRGRLRKGWSVEEAFELLPRQKKKKK